MTPLRKMLVFSFAALPLLAALIVMAAAFSEAEKTSPASAELALLPASASAATVVEAGIKSSEQELRLLTRSPEVIDLLTRSATGDQSRAIVDANTHARHVLIPFVTAGRFRSLTLYGADGRPLIQEGAASSGDLPEAYGAIGPDMLLIGLPRAVGFAPGGGVVADGAAPAGEVVIDITGVVTDAEARPIGTLVGTLSVVDLFPSTVQGDVLSMALDVRSLEFLQHPAAELRFGATLGTGVTARSVFGEETAQAALEQSSRLGETGIVRLDTGVSAFKQINFGPGIITENRWVHISYVEHAALPAAGLSPLMSISLVLLLASAIVVLAAAWRTVRGEVRRQRALQKLEASERRFRRSLERAADPILLIDVMSGGLSFVNDAACELFRRDRAELIGVRFRSLLAIEDRGVADRASADLRLGGAATASARIIVGGGAEVPVQMHIVRLGAGETQVIARDMSAWVEAQRNLEEARAEIANILEAAPDGILLTDAETVVRHVNPAGHRILGAETGALVGHRLDEFIDGDVHCDGRTTALRIDGERVTVDLKVASIDGQTGDATAAGYVVALRDVTEEMALEAQLRQAQKLESVGQLAAGIAHEINTPTQYVSDNTGFVRDAFGELEPLLAAYREPGGPALPEQSTGVDLEFLLEEVPSALDQSMEGLDRIATIVRAMKEFSHPGSVERTSTDLNRAIESTITVARNEWKYAAVVHTDFDPELPQVPVVPGDFNQVVLNLVVNAAHAVAARYGEQGELGRIEVSTARDGDHAVVRVTDNGTGIEPELQARIFEPFFTTKEVGRGTGQGLALAHTVIADRHGGTLTVDSEPGVGSTFTVRLPLVVAVQETVDVSVDDDVTADDPTADDPTADDAAGDDAQAETGAAA